MYITYGEYTALYDAIEDKVFSRLSFEAARYLDRLTTGVDGVKKLKVAMPTDEDDRACVSICAARVVNILLQIEEAEQSASLGRGMVHTENGVHGKAVASVTAGNESVTYTTATGSTAIDAAITDLEERDKLISGTIRRYLAGAKDANGVNLLYMGPYPA
jgi:hypothetical protein